MKPEDVPAELIRTATEGLMGLEVRRVIANVWPEIERQVRERVAAEIESVVIVARRDQSPGEAKADGFRAAARIARGES